MPSSSTLEIEEINALKAKARKIFGRNTMVYHQAYSLDYKFAKSLSSEYLPWRTSTPRLGAIQVLVYGFFKRWDIKEEGKRLIRMC